MRDIDVKDVTRAVAECCIDSCNNLPEGVLKQKDSNNCRLCDEALARRAQVFPLSRGNGRNYFNVRKAQKFMRELAPIEEAYFKQYE